MHCLIASLTLFQLVTVLFLSLQVPCQRVAEQEPSEGGHVPSTSSIASSDTMYCVVMRANCKDCIKSLSNIHDRSQGERTSSAIPVSNSTSSLQFSRPVEGLAYQLLNMDCALSEGPKSVLEHTSLRLLTNLNNSCSVKVNLAC